MIKSERVELIRNIIQNVTSNGDSITYDRICELAGIAEGEDRTWVRNTVDYMVNHGEVLRLHPGVFRVSLTPRKTDSETFTRVWRATRAKKPGWTMRDIEQTAGVSYSMVNRHVRYLEENGFVAKYGKKGATQLFRSTNKQRETREVPHPPRNQHDSYAREKTAAVSIVRIMMDGNPKQARNREKLCEACRLLLARFGDSHDNFEDEQGAGDSTDEAGAELCEAV